MAGCVATMFHATANLEHYHVKHGMLRQQGDVRIQNFGIATLPVGDGICTRDGDVFEISAPGSGLPLRIRPAATARPRPSQQDPCRRNR